MNNASKFQKLDCVMFPRISEKPRLTKISRISSIVSCKGCFLAANIGGTLASTSIAPSDETVVSKDCAASVSEIVLDFSEFSKM